MQLIKGCTHLQGHGTRLLGCTPLKAQLVLSNCNLLILFTILNVHVPCENKNEKISNYIKVSGLISIKQLDRPTDRQTKYFHSDLSRNT